MNALCMNALCVTLTINCTCSDICRASQDNHDACSGLNEAPPRATPRPRDAPGRGRSCWWPARSAALRLASLRCSSCGRSGENCCWKLQSQDMPLEENVAGRPQINGELVNLSRVHHRGLFWGVAIARPDNSFRQVLCKTIGRNIYQLGGEIRIHCGGLCEQFQADQSGDLRVLRKSESGINQDIVARFHRALIPRPRRQVLTVATERTANGGGGIRRIIYIM